MNISLLYFYGFCIYYFLLFVHLLIKRKKSTEEIFVFLFRISSLKFVFLNLLYLILLYFKNFVFLWLLYLLLSFILTFFLIKRNKSIKEMFVFLFRMNEHLFAVLFLWLIYLLISFILTFLIKRKKSMKINYFLISHDIFFKTIRRRKSLV